MEGTAVVKWGVVLAAVIWAAAVPAFADAPLFEMDGPRIDGEYIVVFESPFDTRAMAAQMESWSGGRMMVRFEQVLSGALFQMSRAQALRAAQPVIQAGAGKSVLHRNTAARKISRLAARVRTLGK